MKKLKVKPLGNRVLLRRYEEVEEGGIILPDEAKKDMDFIRAEVVEVGSDSEKIKVKKGDKVLIPSLAGTKLRFDNEEYFIVKSKEILATVE
ncbi:MAG: co-chaperone GroES [Candidatus Bipolaricaulota bacterium]|nr:co-chaperone GroES [Candidatus Bipolaricaulota bacterium]MCS7274057.1 co-chaperone GroES [Candidatus Bipolaricaulota bacterium]MDW8110654.1 co-chaperone GroES [Candidatus Bipolaricaulota bacterium]MDW8328488.1 co-chaperone GroES [Candidatus Bipolaricaulota bacterium]